MSLALTARFLVVESLWSVTRFSRNGKATASLHNFIISQTGGPRKDITQFILLVCFRFLSDLKSRRREVLFFESMKEFQNGGVVSLDPKFDLSSAGH